MKKYLFFWSLFGLTFSAVLGTILHFLYDWTGLALVMPFSAINESTWEHMKLLFVPAFVFSFIMNKYYGENSPKYWLIKLIGTVFGLILIPVLFYTYNGAFGKSPDILNVAFFFIAITLEFSLEYILLKYSNINPKRYWYYLLSLVLIALLFVIFTYYPPNLPLFISPM